MKKIFIKLKFIFDTFILKLKRVDISGFAYTSRGSVKKDKHGTLTMSDGVCLRKGSKLQVRSGGDLKLGRNNTFNTDSSVICRGKISIGNNNAIGQNVLIIDHDHDYKHNVKQLKTGSIEIGDNCWIGANVIILKGSKIGNHVVIGAGTVIKGEVPDYTVVYNKQNLVYKHYEMEN